MNNDYSESGPVAIAGFEPENTTAETIIPVVEESILLEKKTVDTAKVIISKKVTEHQEEINIPLLQEQYEVVRVPVNQTVASLPAAIRHEGDTTIISVVREVLVVEKRYEIVEELHITKRVTEHMETQSITLQSEEVSVTRVPLHTSADNK